jgi:hypothetical protein
MAETRYNSSSAFDDQAVGKPGRENGQELLGKPEVLIIFGHHAKNEAVAKDVASGLGSTSVSLKTDLSLYEQPSGLCYVDAYFKAKSEFDPKTREFREAYLKYREEFLKKGYEFSYGLARAHPDGVVIDVHETPADLFFPYDEGVHIGIVGVDEDVRELKELVREVVPMGKDGKYFFPVIVEKHGVLKDVSDAPECPSNYVTLELLTKPSLYENIAEAQSANIDYSHMRMETRVLKEGRSADLVFEQAKYRRMLELVIPVVAKYIKNRKA